MTSLNGMRVLLAAAWLTAALGLNGCVGAAVGAGATVGVAAMEERGLEQAARDLRMSTAIRESWFQKNHAMVVDLGIEVHEGRVLLTGVTSKAEIQADAVDMAWKVEGVKEVYNEIVLAPETGIIDTANDSWITAQLQSKLTFDKKILSINYEIETVAGVVHLIGVAQNQDELDRVIGHARNIKYVKRVVNYVRLKGAK
jgi:osmotically-inducible protein OsmY